MKLLWPLNSWWGRSRLRHRPKDTQIVLKTRLSWYIFRAQIFNLRPAYYMGYELSIDLAFLNESSVVNGGRFMAVD